MAVAMTGSTARALPEVTSTAHDRWPMTDAMTLEVLILRVHPSSRF